ncbi:DUF3993 domain-containing protein [[Brevibacterium] frigoritolerans]|uniref:DUF3993 domain-containing protein n=1 Tax=Peribacillus frigoritolerans TaxID=450367 RepID=A0A941J7T4_9BACI|nr:DUF3993 domain-containing protein [Peribacillus frigoritolerans]
MEKFVQADVVKVDGGYTAFGSDFAPYYIPFFSYDKNTEIVYGKKVMSFMFRKNSRTMGTDLYRWKNM